MHPNGSRALRWQRWQTSAVAQQYLTPEAVAQGYTLLKVPPNSRDAFFTVVDLILARGRFESQLPRLLDAPDAVHALQAAQAAWHAWRTWTRRLAAYLEWAAGGRAGTCPPVPEALRSLLDILGEDDDA